MQEIFEILGLVLGTLTVVVSVVIVVKSVIENWSAETRQNLVIAAWIFAVSVVVVFLCWSVVIGVHNG